MGKSDKKKQQAAYSFLYSLISRSILFLACFLAAMLLLYFSGNFQSFRDSSLRIILFCSSLTALLLCSFSIIGMIGSLVMAFWKKSPLYIFDKIIVIS